MCRSATVCGDMSMNDDDAMPTMESLGTFTQYIKFDTSKSKLNPSIPLFSVLFFFCFVFFAVIHVNVLSAVDDMDSAAAAGGGALLLLCLG